MIHHHRVTTGDTLSGIARAYNSTVDAIAAANPSFITDPDRIFPGQVLHVPVVVDQAEGVVSSDSVPDGRTQAYHMMGDTMRVPAPFGAHEVPLDIPFVDFRAGATLGDEPPWGDFMIPWGQVDSVSANTDRNVRLHARAAQLFAFVDGWGRVGPHVPDARPNGGLYAYKPFRNVHQMDIATDGLDLRQERDGSWSWRLDRMSLEVPSTHWFYSSMFTPRPAVPDGTVAVGAAIQLRITDLDGGRIDPVVTRWAGCVGADHWPSADGRPPEGKQISRFFQPRRLLLTSDWRWSTGHVHRDWFVNGQEALDRVSPEFIINHPMPIEAVAA